MQKWLNRDLTILHEGFHQFFSKGNENKYQKPAASYFKNIQNNAYSDNI